MIFYNKDLFAKAGLDPDDPKLATYDEFLATSQDARRAAARADYAIYPRRPASSSRCSSTSTRCTPRETGGTLLVEDGKATFADDAGDDVADFWRTHLRRGLAGQEQYQGDAFADGKAAMAIVGPWAVSVYEDVNWGSVPVPTPDGTPADETYTFSDAKNIGLYTACENQGTAWDVLKFATSEEQDGSCSRPPARCRCAPTCRPRYADYFAANPAYAAFGDQAARTVEVPNSDRTPWQMLQTFRDA